jgi:hypothetical protein
MENIKDIIKKIINTMYKTLKGEFVLDRENDEITLALKKPEHLAMQEDMRVCCGSLGLLRTLTPIGARQETSPWRIGCQLLSRTI